MNDLSFGMLNDLSFGMPNAGGTANKNRARSNGGKEGDRR